MVSNNIYDVLPLNVRSIYLTPRGARLAPKSKPDKEIAMARYVLGTEPSVILEFLCRRIDDDPFASQLIKRLEYGIANHPSTMAAPLLTVTPHSSKTPSRTAVALLVHSIRWCQYNYRRGEQDVITTG